MRKILLAALIVIGACISGDAQTASPIRRPLLSVSAKSMQSADSQVMRLSGNVVIVFTGGTAQADSATIHHDSNEIELSGNVRLKLDTTTAK